METVSAYVVGGGAALKVAETATMDAGMENVVLAAVALTKVTPLVVVVQRSKTWPEGAVLAVMETLAPAAYWPEPEPLVTVSAYVAGGGGVLPPVAAISSTMARCLGA